MGTAPQLAHANRLEQLYALYKETGLNASEKGLVITGPNTEN